MTMREPSHHGESAPPAPPESFEQYTRRKLREHEEQLAQHERLIGQESSTTLKTPATGLHLGMDELRTEMQTLGGKVDNLAAQIDADIKARKAAADAQAEAVKAAADAAKQKREPLSWATRAAVATAISVLVGSGLVALGAFVARHWHW